MSRNPMRPGGRGSWASRGLRARLGVAVALGALSVGALLWSCSGGHDAETTVASEPTAAPAPSASAAPDCSVPNAGCFCKQPGQVLKCGEVVSKSRDYLSCGVGTRLCQPDATWSPCNRAQVVTLNSWQVKGLRLLGQPAAFSANSVCDPALFEINTTFGQEGGFDDGAVSAGDGGVTLTYYGVGSTQGCGDAAAPPLLVSPSDASLVLTQISTPPNPSTLSFQANLSGCAGDGSVNAIWTVDQPGIATVADGGFTLAYPYAGPIHVTAYAGSLSGTATVNVVINAVDTSGIDAGDAAGIAKAFTQTCGADAGGGG